MRNPIRGNRITKMYAYVSIDPKDDCEGVCAFVVDGKWIPMVGADEARIRSYRPMAEQIARLSGQKLTLVCFSIRETLEEVAL